MMKYKGFAFQIGRYDADVIHDVLDEFNFTMHTIDDEVVDELTIDNEFDVELTHNTVHFGQAWERDFDNGTTFFHDVVVLDTEITESMIKAYIDEVFAD